MEFLNLPAGRMLHIEHNGDKLRLVIRGDAKELACRKTTLKQLTAALLSDKNHLFKGRLQLVTNVNTIDILLSGEPIGTISRTKFSELLNTNNEDH